MRTTFLIASVALLSCTDGPNRDLPTEDAAAVMGASADGGASSAVQPGSRDVSASGAYPWSEEWRPPYCGDRAAAALPASPAKFSVELQRTGGFCPCPVYSIAIDQDGLVRFNGERFVARFGPLRKQVSPADARAIYDALYQAGYGKLGRCYLERVDGCDGGMTDAFSSFWNVSADGVSQAVHRYHGCFHPSPELAQVDATATLVLERAGVSGWVGPPVPLTPETDALGALKTASYRLSSAGQSLGMLTIYGSSPPASAMDAAVAEFRKHSWELADCAGIPLASGDVRNQSSLYVLVAGGYNLDLTSRRAIKEELPIALPTLGDVGSILIDVPTTGDLQIARAQRGDEDIPLELVAGQPGC